MLGAIEFRGTTEPKEVEKWIRTLEKLFRVMQCLEERKVDLTVLLLQEDAEDWWILEEGLIGKTSRRFSIGCAGMGIRNKSVMIVVEDMNELEGERASLAVDVARRGITRVNVKTSLEKMKKN
ncbi:A-kinase anchor protein 12 [Cucumis melo var. makuwa]|uniref:A-kinase anchor protein 12 n=1 Tax=Cucumis melo var. makuwa TaxID=1194695 RepID=A0A5A7SMT4_CUCMM|nr:A-kinase anchor protein 12 [Cucumis melo var. makuwa]TYK16770.1 A-kinase anchor protein 12 [Cucumis melo var. makuwa]